LKLHAALNFGSEVLVLKKRDEQRLEAAQMKFLRHLLGITKLDKEKNQSIREKTGAQNIVKEIKQYQQKWLQHVQRMGKNRLPKQALRCRPKGRRNLGRLTKFTLRIKEQATRLTPFFDHDDDDDDDTAVLARHYKNRGTLIVVLHMFCYICMFCVRSVTENRKVTVLNRCIHIRGGTQKKPDFL